MLKGRWHENYGNFDIYTWLYHIYIYMLYIWCWRSIYTYIIYSWIFWICNYIYIHAVWSGFCWWISAHILHKKARSRYNWNDVFLEELHVLKEPWNVDLKNSRRSFCPHKSFISNKRAMTFGHLALAMLVVSLNICQSCWPVNLHSTLGHMSKKLGAQDSCKGYASCILGGCSLGVDQNLHSNLCPRIQEKSKMTF